MVDGSDTSVQGAAAQLAQMPLGASARLREAPLASTPPAAPIDVVAFYNPERRSAVNIVPGLIGVILTMTMVLFTGVSIVRERERGNMELLIATPLSRTELMVGKVLPFIAIGLVQTTVILALGLWLFTVPVRGSVLDVYLAAGLLILANLTLGLMISTKAQSQFQAMQMTFVRWLAEVLPLTHFLRLIRGIMLRGAGLAEMWIDVAALLAFTAVMMGAAILRFHKRLD
jgi:ABC-2 type transport system permease protein